MKALVWQDAGAKTWISYNEPAWLAKRHGVEVAELMLSSMSFTLNEIASNAAADRSHELGGDDQLKPPKDAKGSAF